MNEVTRIHTRYLSTRNVKNRKENPTLIRAINGFLHPHFMVITGDGRDVFIRSKINAGHSVRKVDDS